MNNKTKIAASAKAPLPNAVSVVGDRIGLDYDVERKSTTRNYIELYQEASRLDFDKLKTSYYSLDESRTSKKLVENREKKKSSQTARNPLKLNAKIRKSLYKLTDEEKKTLSYTTFEQVHQLWQQYAGQVLTDKDKMAVFRMDLHGCKLTCSASKNPSLVGSDGIVVQETKNTFLLINERNRLLTLPKRESIFEFKAGHSSYRIHGCNLLFTSQTRSKVKYKQKRATLGI